jgi:hypothetical protein
MPMQRIDIQPQRQPQESLMQTKIVIAIALIALAGAGSAFAQEGTQEFTNIQSLSTKSRAEVKAELFAAQRAGEVFYGEASPGPVARSTLTRTQVQAEAREAQRLGLTPFGEEQARAATPADLESIRIAGQRAIDTPMARNAR